MELNKPPLSTASLLRMAEQLGVPLNKVVPTIALFDEGATVPFIARYRKEVTGNLDEVQVRNIEEKLAYFRDLEDRRSTVLQSIGEQGKLTPELRARIEAVLEKNELEDLYLPYKPKRRTKASIAREKGLEPLADYIWNQTPAELPLTDLATAFLSEEKGVATIEEALEGARHILSERINEDAEIRKRVREMMLDGGRVVSHAIPGVEDPEGKFKMYADYSEPVSKIPSHRMLAVRRGSKEGILGFEIELDREAPLTYLRGHVVHAPGDWVEHLVECVMQNADYPEPCGRV